MRKITQDSVNAFMNGENFRKQNMEVDAERGIVSLFLHGNLIATRTKRHGKWSTQITNAGWKSNTTKERLNAIPGVNIYQRKGVWYLNDKEWNGQWITIK